jgi:anti-sigma factor RsiW
MRHPESSRLSDLLEGHVPRKEAEELEKHLDGCQSCAALFQDLAEIREEARRLPDRLPSRDLWPDIARAMKVEDEEDVLRLHPRRREDQEPTGTGRTIRLPVPQAVAASVALVLISGALGGWLATGPLGPSDPPAVAAPAVSPEWAELVADAEPTLADRAREIVELEERLEAGRARLDEATVKILEKNLATIDGAIRESVEALRADPGNRFLRENLERAVLARGDYLRNATRLAFPST